MLKVLPVLLLLIIVAVVIGCQPTKNSTDNASGNTASSKEEIKEIKEIKENNPDELGFTWSVIYLQELDARHLPKEVTSISFEEENKINIKLSVNSCVGSYNATSTKIKITEEGCTEACCDNDFDKQLLALIRGNEFSYALNGDKLELSAANSKVVLTKK